jgi:hypothetical protein
MPCNSHFAQLVDIFNAYFEAFEKRIEDEARTLLGPVARLEDLDPHSLAIVGRRTFTPCVKVDLTGPLRRSRVIRGCSSYQWRLGRLSSW